MAGHHAPEEPARDGARAPDIIMAGPSGVTDDRLVSIVGAVRAAAARGRLTVVEFDAAAVVSFALLDCDDIEERVVCGYARVHPPPAGVSAWSSSCKSAAQLGALLRALVKANRARVALVSAAPLSAVQTLRCLQLFRALPSVCLLILATEPPARGDKQQQKAVFVAGTSKRLCERQLPRASQPRARAWLDFLDASLGCTRALSPALGCTRALSPALVPRTADGPAGAAAPSAAGAAAHGEAHGMAAAPELAGPPVLVAHRPSFPPNGLERCIERGGKRDGAGDAAAAGLGGALFPPVALCVSDQLLEVRRRPMLSHDLPRSPTISHALP